MQVAADIFQIQLPLPFPLKIVNCYALREDNGWTIIDTGIHYPPGEAAWQAAFTALEFTPADIQRIILTHAHPDHFGMAGWLAQTNRLSVLLAPEEERFAQQVWYHGPDNEDVSTEFFRLHGMPADLAEALRVSMVENRSMTTPWPATTILQPGSMLTIGRRTFQAIATPGHSVQHLAFYCADEQLMLCGDTVLTKITPNVSRWPDGLRNPLADFLTTLDMLGTLEVKLALPGHGPLISNFAQRLGELRQHHVERLAAIEAAVGEGASAFEVCTVIFPTSTLSPHQLRFAIAETLAHLEYLAEVGRIERFEQPKLMYRSQ